MRIRNLAEFQRDLQRAASRIDEETERALERAGEPLLRLAQALAPRRTGHLASLGRINRSGDDFALEFDHIKAGVLEFAGSGKYASLNSKWGQPPRFAFRALEQQESRITETIERELEDVVSAYGWFR